MILVLVSIPILVEPIIFKISSSRFEFVPIVEMMRLIVVLSRIVFNYVDFRWAFGYFRQSIIMIFFLSKGIYGLCQSELPLFVPKRSSKV